MNCPLGEPATRLFDEIGNSALLGIFSCRSRVSSSEPKRSALCAYRNFLPSREDARMLFCLAVDA